MEAGDTLCTLASNFNVTINSIAAANPSIASLQSLPPSVASGITVSLSFGIVNYLVLCISMLELF